MQALGNKQILARAAHFCSDDKRKIGRALMHQCYGGNQRPSCGNVFIEPVHFCPLPSVKVKMCNNQPILWCIISLS